MAKDEVKARLAPIPVYTVANPKNEFVLVAGEVRRQMVVVLALSVPGMHAGASPWLHGAVRAAAGGCMEGHAHGP